MGSVAVRAAVGGKCRSSQDVQCCLISWCCIVPVFCCPDNHAHVLGIIQLSSAYKPTSSCKLLPLVHNSSLSPCACASATVLHQAPAASGAPARMPRDQLKVLSDLMVAGFGPTGTEACHLDDIMKGLAERGIHASREQVVAELAMASSSDYDKLPAAERWCQKIFWDAADESLCAL